MSRRSAQLKAVTRDFINVHEAWTADENRPNPDETYWDAVDALRDTFTRGDIPDECRPIADAVSAFLDEVEEFDKRDRPGMLYPHARFWEARESVAKALKVEAMPELPPLEPIAELAKLPNMSHRQIATMYGFRDREGVLLPHLVQRELDKPGSVLETAGAVDGRDWCDPRMVERQAALEASERHVAAPEPTTGMPAKGRAVDVAEPKACKESPRELWEQNVSIKQAAKMLGKPAGEVESMFNGFEADRNAAQAGNVEPDQQTTMIYQFADEGMEPAKIASTMSMTKKHIEKVLAGRVKETATA